MMLSTIMIIEVFLIFAFGYMTESAGYYGQSCVDYSNCMVYPHDLKCINGNCECGMFRVRKSVAKHVRYDLLGNINCAIERKVLLQKEKYCTDGHDKNKVWNNSDSDCHCKDGYFYSTESECVKGVYVDFYETCGTFQNQLFVCNYKNQLYCKKKINKCICFSECPYDEMEESCDCGELDISMPVGVIFVGVLVSLISIFFWGFCISSIESDDDEGKEEVVNEEIAAEGESVPLDPLPDIGFVDPTVPILNEKNAEDTTDYSNMFPKFNSEESPPQFGTVSEPSSGTFLLDKNSSTPVSVGDSNPYPINPSSTYPVSPLASDPVAPSVSYPITPSVSYPVAPSVYYPVAPSVSYPVAPPATYPVSPLSTGTFAAAVAAPLATNSVNPPIPYPVSTPASVPLPEVMHGISFNSGDPSSVSGLVEPSAPDVYNFDLKSYDTAPEFTFASTRPAYSFNK